MIERVPENNPPKELSDAALLAAIERYFERESRTITDPKAIRAMVPRVRERMRRINSTHANTDEAVSEALGHLLIQQEHDDNLGNRKEPDDPIDDNIGNRR